MMTNLIPIENSIVRSLRWICFLKLIVLVQRLAATLCYLHQMNSCDGSAMMTAR